MSSLAEKILSGDRRSLARALSAVENRFPGIDDLLADLHGYSGRVLRLGITGAPGVGKSTLVDCVATHLRRGGASIAILAVDPSSPFSGGAILGDRVRMQRHHDDPGVFIRSMASRGELGGLAPAVGDSLTVLEASGFDAVLIETAGVGQSEVDVMQVADKVAVVLTPALGDDIQAAKAGIMEIGDVFVINKADQPGTEELHRQLLSMISLIPEGQPKPPIVRTSASLCEGIEDLVKAVRQVESRRASAAYWKRCLSDRIAREFQGMLSSGPEFPADLDHAAQAVVDGSLNPYSYVREVVGRLRQQWKP